METLFRQRTTRGMNWDGEGLVLLTAVTITEVSPSFRQTQMNTQKIKRHMDLSSSNKKKNSFSSFDAEEMFIS